MSKAWKAVRDAFDLDAIIAWLGSIDWLGIGAGWVDSLWDGIVAGWRGLTSWLGDAIRGLLDLLPDWLKERLGISAEGDVAGAVEGSAPERPGAPAHRRPESLVATAVRVGGRSGWCSTERRRPCGSTGSAR